jgi:Tol biopolymer transport system component
MIRRWIMTPRFRRTGGGIVFCSERSGSPDLYAIDLEHGGSLKPLTRGQFMEAAPAFTPDGKSLLFVSDRDGNADIFTMPLRPDDPTGADKATNLTKNASGDFRPTISPDEKTVVFSSDRDTRMETINARSTAIRCEIYLMNIDGSNPQRLTSSNAFNGSPAWSRDGKTIYFYSDRDGGAFRIWAMDADGGHPHVVTPKERPAFSPAVMPDSRIAFAEKTAEGVSNRVGRAVRQRRSNRERNAKGLPLPGLRSARPYGLHRGRIARRNVARLEWPAIPRARRA